MKMKTNKFMTYALSAMMLGSLAACSSDDSEPDNGGNSGGETTDTPYVWGTEGSIKTCDHLLFNEDKSENKKGTVIGNGDQEFVFKGTQTLAKGTYLLKGWVYVGAGSTLTIEPGTVIKGDKDTQAALIIEPGGKLIAEGKQNAPIVFTSEMPKGQRKPGDWGGLIICGKAKNNQGVLNQQIRDCGIIIPTAAMRDEGTSFHYAPPSDEIPANPKYRGAFEAILRETGVDFTEGKVWTTDAFYRETRAKFEKRKAQGCVCVDMECSALMALAQFRGIDVFEFFYAGDNLDREQWDPRSLSTHAKLDEKDRAAYLALELARKITL